MVPTAAVKPEALIRVSGENSFSGIVEEGTLELMNRCLQVNRCQLLKNPETMLPEER